MTEPPTAVSSDIVPTARRASLLRRIEAMAVRATQRHWSRMPESLARRLKPQVAQVGDGVLTLLATSDALRMNRVTGLGHRGGASEAAIDDIISRYRADGLRRFSLELGPGPQHAHIVRWLDARGFARRGGSLLLLRDLRRPVPRVSSPLRVTRARPAQHVAIARIHRETFAVPESRAAWSLAALAARENETFVALDGRETVAAGTLHREGDLAWLGGGATRTPWRRHGAHAALIAARLARARRAGCRWAWSETAAPKPGRPDGSRRNLVRMGFEPACVKPVFVWGEG